MDTKHMRLPCHADLQLFSMRAVSEAFSRHSRPSSRCHTIVTRGSLVWHDEASCPHRGVSQDSAQDGPERPHQLILAVRILGSPLYDSLLLSATNDAPAMHDGMSSWCPSAAAIEKVRLLNRC